VPYAKTGGLADVAGALLKEYRGMKKEAHIILPLYRSIKNGDVSLKDTRLKIKVPVGERTIEARLYHDKSMAYFIEYDEFFNREELYGTPRGDYADNASRFIFFSRGVLETCKRLNFQPDVIHCNDWQTGLVPLYLKTLYKYDPFFRNTASLLTIHNLGYQGLFPSTAMYLTGLARELFNPEGVEFYGMVNFLKAGLISADVLTTVSNTYAEEILQTEFGFGLEGVLKTRQSDLYGVVNGIDYDEWDPSRDTIIPEKFSSSDLHGKAGCKKRLVKEVSLDKVDRPLVSMIGRLSAQKGLGLVLQSLEDLISSGINLVFLGKGDESIQVDLSEAARKYKGRVSVTVGFDESLAHRIYAGSDFFLIPSKYEPCGLGQLIAMRYGSIPIGRKTGGIADTVKDFNPMAMTGTGFLFSDFTPYALQDAVKRGLCLYTDGTRMKKIVAGAMKMDFSWRRSAKRYLQLYDYAMKKKKVLV
jgi:starch synthase